MKKKVTSIAALAVLAAVIGIIVYFVSGGMSPAKKLMKNHPYTYESGKTLGKEQRDSYVEDKTGVVYIAYPKTKNEATDTAIKGYLNSAKEEFSAFMAEQTEAIPRLVFDYKTAAGEGYTSLTCFYEIASFTEDGKETLSSAKERTYYIDSEKNILDLDGVLGENSEKKLNLMLQAGDRSTDNMECFTVNGDVLTLHWADAEQEFSVKAVERAGLIDPTKPMIALTFDDGPGKYSKEFADLLAEYDGHATFFVLGVNVPNFAENVKYVYEMGNEIASHTHSHKDLNKLSESAIQEELDKASEAIYEAIGAYPTLVRAPYGNANSKVMKVIDGPMIKWSVDTEDWRSRDAQAVKNELLKNTKDGDIILLHEIYKSSLEGLRLAIDDLADQGYQFVTVSELMRYRGVEPEVKHYYSFYPDD
ncbi:MAG: polysaccharide deacetylase family protein [Clostridia bacterium]|nr:polysaccharide deacetylase family protein [Clostridia bacterium]